MTTSTSFFSQLPTELRCKIWKLAMPDPRVIEISYYNKFACDNNRPKSENTLVYGSSVKPPALLQVCQESREQMQKQYKLVFQSACSPNPIYFNFEIDILFFSDRRYDTDTFWKYIQNPYQNYEDFINIRSYQFLAPQLHIPELKDHLVRENFYMHCFLQSTRPEEIAQIRRVAHTIRKSEGIYNSNCVALRLFSGLREYIMAFPIQDDVPIGQRGVGSRLNFTFEKASAQLMSLVRHPEMFIIGEKLFHESISCAELVLSRLKNLDVAALDLHHCRHVAYYVKEELLLSQEEARQREMGMVIVPNKPGWWASWDVPEIVVGFVLVGRSG